VFGVERTERVEVHVYDVGGRRLRKLADRVFEGKSHELIWDGADDAGRRVGPGVYFYRVRSGSFTGQKKLTVLRD
jgi:flagellar hook assembly protein FlgD